jgi:hypothetical protein
MLLKPITIHMTAAEVAELMELKRLTNEGSSVRYSTSRVVAEAIKTTLRNRDQQG